jgi:hypothetical protein
MLIEQTHFPFDKYHKFDRKVFIKDKYDYFRPILKNGDIALVQGISLLAKSIAWGDAENGVNAKWTHAFIVSEVGERLMAIQSMAQGVDPAWLSKEVLGCADVIFLRPQFPQELIDSCMDKFMVKAESGIPYNKAMLLKILIYRKFGWNIKELGDNEKKDICSVAAFWDYGQLLPLTCYSKETIKQDFITPMDGIRFLDPAQIKILE